MTISDILNAVGEFSSFDNELFEKYTSKHILNKNEVLLNQGDVCESFYFVSEGSFIQYQTKDVEEHIVDLHLKNEWMFNQESLTEQMPSKTSIRAFSDAEIIALSLNDFHCLCANSQAFLQFGKLLNQTKFRTLLYDNALNPTEKYRFITKTKPELINSFPLKLIASYLKVTPETLSRTRASFIS